MPAWHIVFIAGTGVPASGWLDQRLRPRSDRDGTEVMSRRSTRRTQSSDQVVWNPRRYGAKRFLPKPLRGLRYVPWVIVVERLASYGAADCELVASVEYRQSKYLKIGLKNFQQPTAVRERVMKRFASLGQAQRLLIAFRHIRGHAGSRRHLTSAP